MLHSCDLGAGGCWIKNLARKTLQRRLAGDQTLTLDISVLCAICLALLRTTNCKHKARTAARVVYQSSYARAVFNKTRKKVFKNRILGLYSILLYSSNLGLHVQFHFTRPFTTLTLRVQVQTTRSRTFPNPAPAPVSRIFVFEKSGHYKKALLLL